MNQFLKHKFNTVNRTYIDESRFYFYKRKKSCLNKFLYGMKEEMENGKTENLYGKNEKNPCCEMAF